MTTNIFVLIISVCAIFNMMVLNINDCVNNVTEKIKTNENDKLSVSLNIIVTIITTSVHSYSIYQLFKLLL
jgi:undecaprenyl pyrophosphate phosphatase UppP